MTALFEIDNLAVERGNRVALKGTVSLDPGEIVAVRGASGSGKSLFLRAIARLDPVAGGECRLGGRSWSEFGAPDWRARVLYLLPDTPLWGETLEGNFRAVAALSAQSNRPHSLDTAREMLDRLGLGDAMSRDPLTLSTGEQQRAALVRALWLEPTIVLLDEPTSSLDAEAVSAAESLIAEWTAAGEHAALWVTHSEEQTLRRTHRRLRVQNGRVHPDPERAA